MQIIFNGLISGFAIALLALAFQLVYLPTRVFFVGLAGLYTLAPYLYLLPQKAGLHWSLCVLFVIIVSVALSALFELVNHAPLTRKGASDGAHLISSLGIGILIVQIVTMIWGNNTQTIRIGADSTFTVSGYMLTGAQLIMAGAGFILLATSLALLHRSNLGLRLRSLADNPVQFALYGYNVDSHRIVAFGTSGLLATASALLTSYDIGFVPSMGLSSVLLAVVAVIIGGRTSFIGPIVGGLLLGIIRSQVVWQLSARWQDAFTFAALALFLLLRPQGLFGQKTRIEETV